VLNRLDEYPIHQTAEPLAHASTADKNFYDRFWFNGYTREADLYFGIGLGLYPNRRVMDAAVSVVRDGRQHVLRASRLAPRERTEIRVDPISIEVVEPMRTIRVRVAPNEYGIEGELLFRARTPAVEEPRLTLRQAGRAVMDSTRFTQFGTWEGHLSVAGESIPIEPARVLATRDRSWGLRPVGERDAVGPPAPPPQFFFLWSPLQFDDVCTHFQVNEDGAGHPWHASGVIVPVVKDASEIEEAVARIEPMARVEHAVRWRKGMRRSEGARITLFPPRGEPHVIDLEPLLHFQMRGIGYLDFEWGHGMWKGEHVVNGDCWVLAELDPLDPRHVHVQQLCRARYGERRGIGVLEQVVIGAHAPSGFSGLFDPAA
jgi:hypothetical protein